MKVFLITLAVVVLVGGGVAVAVVITKNNKETPNQNKTEQHQESSVTQESSSEAGRSSSVSVSISNFEFPQKIKVSKGTKVTWTNQDSDGHTVTADSGGLAGLDSPTLSKGQSFSFTFDQIGTHNYHCTLHPFMTGSVEVVEEHIQEVIQ